MGRGKLPAPALPMTGRQYRLLEQEASKRTTLRQYNERIAILLRGSEGQSNSHVARELGISLNTVKSWRRRWESDYESLLEFEKGSDGKKVSDYELLREMLKSLNDLPRSGTPKRITLAQEQQIVALACEKPTDYGVEMTNWTLEMLAKVAIAQGILESISPRYVGEILKKVQVATA
jgi:putative transposase